MPEPATATSDGWAAAEDADEVHALLCASDRYAADKHGMPAPVRNPASSRGLVDARQVQLLRRGGVAAAMFTLSWTPPYQPPEEFPAAHRPAYLQRLAVNPECLRADGLLGVQALRRAVELAGERGADAIRAETNPDLGDVVVLLTSFGFEVHGPIRTQGWMRRIYLQKPLTATHHHPPDRQDHRRQCDEKGHTR